MSLLIVCDSVVLPELSNPITRMVKGADEGESCSTGRDSLQPMLEKYKKIKP
jgi:hypothetical protein